MSSDQPVFAARHIGPSAADQRAMLAALGYDDLDGLLEAALPPGAEPPASLADLPEPRSEPEVLAELRGIASRNTVRVSMIGLGYHDTITPAVIRRNVFEDPAWYTAYTPYQPEISQGRLEALLNFQTMVADLTALPVANASLLDEASAAVEAMTLARRAAKRNAGNVFLADADCLPQTLEVLRTRAEPLGIELRVQAVTEETDFTGSFGVLLQYPGASGAVRDLAPVADAAHAAGATVAVAADILALTLLKPPGEMGADIAVGSTQRFGVPMFYGGPHAAYMAVSDGFKRQLPGRLVGVSVDADGRPAYRLSLQAREQHIRREKATSNICTAQVLLAVAASMYACYHGPDGLAAIASHAHRSAVTLARTLEAHGLRTDHPDWFFDTVRVVMPGPAEARAALRLARLAGYNLCDAGDGVVQVSCDETTTTEHLRNVAAALIGAVKTAGDGPSAESVTLVTADADRIPGELARTSKFLTHPVFTAHRSETAMLRYLRRLSDLDVALDRSMIPLGSCTMKLNATAEMEPVTWPEFARLHPLAPPEDALGYQELISSLERWLCAITGYDACSLQPNAGSAGELAGLLAIRGYHASRGQADRDVCLIPSSAHGTNAASAILAGLRVVVVRCGDDGAVSLEDLTAKLSEHDGRVAAIMLTYPSTNGVYEETVTRVCSLVHDAGGQVYMDGANLNALAGLAAPALLGGDVSHLNLHKTFCIPHGGGGPGVGPVAARSHLAPFLPATASSDATAGATTRSGESGSSGPVAAARYGSAGILPISWAYIAMMGESGLRRATQVAVLSANYVAYRLAPYFPLVHTGRNGLVAHECIIDLRNLPGGITVDDVAKRLIDYGFHAPTMSFPVPGTFMVEPTESENLDELDQFCEAMISIRAEIDKVASGAYDADDNPLKNAPHTAEMLITDDWKHAYPPADGAFPGGRGTGRGSSAPGARAKYWPPVRRVDQAYGDRNLVCACPSPDAFAE
ncbi:MAG: aminomethyl-transferring glycine dehydrogenase [Nocardiopsaceae bacterium]|nr:aminomethyl-transferring glycine dehydrogenase [Nocardiopsaceae bacterium]